MSYCSVQPALQDHVVSWQVICGIQPAQARPCCSGAHPTAELKRDNAFIWAQVMPVCHRTSMMLLYTAACGREPDCSMTSNVSKAAHLDSSSAGCSSALPCECSR